MFRENTDHLQTEFFNTIDSLPEKEKKRLADSFLYGIILPKRGVCPLEQKDNTEITNQGHYIKRRGY